MASRKRNVGERIDEENAGAKRRRVDENSDNDDETTPLSSSLSFEDLNDDILVHMLSFLHYEDLNSFAMVDRRSRDLRSHESLDQTRSGTIVFTENTTLTTLPSLYNAIRGAGGWNEVFSGNRTHLRVEGLERLQESGAPSNLVHASRGSVERAGALMVGVSSLTVTLNRESFVQRGTLNWLSPFLPNLTSLDLDQVKLDHPDSGEVVLFVFFTTCPLLKQMTWLGCPALPLGGFCLINARRLSDIFLDECCFVSPRAQRANDYVLEHSRNLERLSIKNATWSPPGSSGLPEPLPQDKIIKMVRRHPTLRWLRSDLTEQNIAVLKLERPEITFVSE